MDKNDEWLKYLQTYYQQNMRLVSHKFLWIGSLWIFHIIDIFLILFLILILIMKMAQSKITHQVNTKNSIMLFPGTKCSVQYGLVS